MSGTFINSFSWPEGLDVVPLVYLHNQQAKTCFRFDIDTGGNS